MKEDYTIEQLEKTFKQHEEKYELENAERRANFNKNFPDSELPDHLKEDAFNISEALHVICKEINILKYKMSLFEEVTETSISVEEMDKTINDISGLSKDLLC
jgi:hypothetical protein